MPSWAEDRVRAADNRPRRWLAGADWPWLSVYGDLERYSDEAIASVLCRMGWPVVPCSERCDHGDWAREAASYARQLERLNAGTGFATPNPTRYST